MQVGLVREVLHRLEMAQDIIILSSGEVWLLNLLKQRCLSLASLERTIARLRSRIHYLKEGNANTKFFHSQACYRKKKNFISKIEEDVRLATNHDDMQKILEEYFCNLLGADLQRPFTIDLSNYHRAAMDLSVLEQPFSEKEVRDTIVCLPSDKAPGPDGFTGKFYKTCWDIIKVDIMAALNSLYHGNAFKLDLLNSAYLILLPKREDASSAGDFRPISLIHSFAKLVTKILANRLGPYLQDLVAANQSAFIRGRSIHDNFMLVQQSIKFLHKRISSLLLKLDISKAFDSVSWAFLMEILTHLGFGPVWRNLISNLLFTSSTQVLLNGSPSNHIFHRRGLRQGYPLSPMLFVLVMDVLCSLFRVAENRGLLQSLGGADVRSSLHLCG
jgi:hypothetical protein